MHLYDEYFQRMYYKWTSLQNYFGLAHSFLLDYHIIYFVVQKEPLCFMHKSHPDAVCLLQVRLDVPFWD